MKESIVFSRIVMLCCLAFVTALSAMASSPNNDVWQSHAQDVNQAMENFIEAAEEYHLGTQGQQRDRGDPFAGVECV